MHNRMRRALRLAVLSTLLLVTLQLAQAQTEVVLYNFCSEVGCVDGAKPSSSLAPDGAGNFYGTTQLGGTNSAGTVFELSPNGVGGYNESVLYSFCSAPNCVDGSNPTSNLILDASGNLYGTACAGGYYGRTAASPCANGSNGYGVVFKLSSERGGICHLGSHTGNGWCETVLHNFKSTPDGASPVSGLTWDSLGNLYGTTYAGGRGSGAVYELSPNGKGGRNESVLYNFCSQPSCADGAYPSGLVETGSGNLYGTTQNGGTYEAGTVFELSPQPVGGCPSGNYTGNGWCEAILHAFAGHPTDGKYPFGTPVFDTAGNIYGTTFYGGRGSCNRDAGCGTVWKLTPDAAGEYAAQILHSFASGPANLGCCDPIRLPHYPLTGVVLDISGNIYGTTAYGGSSTFCTGKKGSSLQGCGTLFELAWLPLKPPRYKFELPWIFNLADGANLQTSLTLDDGNLYGTAYGGGLGDSCPYPEGCGVAFEIAP